MSKIIGIDLGTTNSVVAVMEGKDPKVIQNSEGSRTTPSIVAFRGNDRLVGLLAKRQAVTNPKETIHSIKRFMGRRHSEVTSEEKMVPYKISGENSITVDGGGKTWTPPEISAMVLKYLKTCAEDYLGEEVTEAVITVPAYFNDAQRQATKDAGKIAGLNVRRIVNEPTAASLAYGLEEKQNQKIAVFDLGGGTFDISILDVGDGVFEVLSTNGDTHLGGDDFDEIIINYICDDFKNQYNVDLRKDPLALQRVREAAEKAKCELSSAMSTDINLPYISADSSGPKHYQTTINRARFEELVDGLLERLKAPCRTCIQDAEVETKDIDQIILVGGSTRMPCVQAIVKEIFGKDPNKTVNPDEVVAVGAAIQGGILSGEINDVLLLDVTPLTLGLETLGGVMTPLIGRNTTVPAEKTETFSTASDNQPAVDIHVLQGERKMAQDNRTLGKFQLDGIPPAPRGTPQIEVTFKIDANGILSVSAKDKATGKEQNITIKDSSGLSEEEIARMVKEAEEHAAEDEKRKKLVETRNAAGQLAFRMKKMIEENEEKYPEDCKVIKEKMEKLESLSGSEDLEEIETAIKDAEKPLHEFAEKLYAQNSNDVEKEADSDGENVKTVDAEAEVISEDSS